MYLSGLFCFSQLGFYVILLLSMKTATNQIGIITCAKATVDMDCCASPCLRDLRENGGVFGKNYTNPPILVGILSCAGCASKNNFINKIRSIAEFGVDAIHFSFCMLAMCPFLDEHISAVTREFPNLKIVKGTHATNIDTQLWLKYVDTAKKHGLKMNDVISRRIVTKLDKTT